MPNSTLQNNTNELNELLFLANSLPTEVTDAVKYSAQTLTDEQKAQARANIGAASSNDIATNVSSTIKIARW